MHLFSLSRATIDILAFHKKLTVSLWLTNLLDELKKKNFAAVFPSICNILLLLLLMFT